MAFTHSRQYAAADSITVIQGSTRWDLFRTEEPVRLWLDDGTGLALREYNWDTDTWSVVSKG